MTEQARVTLEVAAGIARLTFDHPRRMNAITGAMWRALPGLLDQVADDPAIRVLLLQGAGERAFCTGNDISEFEAIRADAAQSAAYNAWQRDVAARMAALEKPAIAAIHGHCLGAGLELALQCDLRFASPEARMGVPAVRLGLPYRLEDIAKLVDVIGLAQTRLMVLTGRSFAGAELERMGLVTALLPDRAAMLDAAEEAAAEIAAAAPLALRAAKAALFEIARRDAPPDLARAQALADACYDSRDYAEGRAARREARPPRFTGR
ncbi:enoyl-CoA hydratase-related protein [Sediminicoccus sp. KRV36]|uniref:enoyl-CoA hydratase-related protein n=1 Tax=Sediminicoccus sp. KRV36 TaxID=3133721 RepID=UPI0020108D27|nr:enoyl-CoA hydratase-related protein [Sediminicoccus rosea]UPY38030.1 enoyl-CoA hydratase/isomerase family protein [Sediminicoccus rosea]